MVGVFNEMGKGLTPCVNGACVPSLRTTLCLQYSPKLIAMGMIHVALKLSGLKFTLSEPWYTVVSQQFNVQNFSVAALEGDLFSLSFVFISSQI